MTVEPPVLVQPGEHGQPGARALGHPDGDRAVERDHRVRRGLLEQCVQRGDLRPVGRRRGGRLGVDGRDRGLQLVGAERSAGERALDQRDPLARSARGPSAPRSCSSSGTSAPPAAVRAALRASVRSMSASSPAVLAVGGQPRVDDARQPDRLAGQLAPLEGVAARRRVALVEHRGRARAARRAGGGSAPPRWAGRTWCRPRGSRPCARLMRCAIVASGTRNAAAISAVVRPPTARSVSAICDGVESAGWQHRKSRASESSAASPPAGATRSATGVRAASTSSRRRRACSLRISSVSRRVATVTSQARGCSGTPSAGHCAAAAISASCTASSQASSPPWRRSRLPSTCGACSRSSASTLKGRPGSAAPPSRRSARWASGRRSRSPGPRSRRRAAGSRRSAPSPRPAARP